MPSFSTLSFLLAATCAVFTSTSAIPIVQRDVTAAAGVSIPAVINSLPGGSVVNSVVGEVEGVENTAIVPIEKAIVDKIPLGITLASRQTQSTLPAVLTDGQNRLSAVANQIHSIIDAKVTVQVTLVLPLVGQLKDILTDIVSEVQHIAANPVGSALDLNGVAVTALDIANLLAGILTLVFTLLAAILKVVAAADATVLTPLIADIGGLVAALLAAVLSIVVGLLPLLTGLIGGLIPTITQLNLGNVISVLKL